MITEERSLPLSAISRSGPFAFAALLLLLAAALAACTAKDEPEAVVTEQVPTAENTLSEQPTLSVDEEEPPALDPSESWVPVGTDPLSGAEIESAAGLVDGSAEFAEIIAEGPAERLYVERRIMPKDESGEDVVPRRLANVMTYAYGRDAAVLAVVDIEAREITGLEILEGVQPPLNEAETDRALEIALSDEGVIEALEQAAEAMGASLEPERLRATPIMFFAETSSPGLREAFSKCGRHRCAQLLLDLDGVLINAFPLVDLSAGTVLAADIQAIDR